MFRNLSLALAISVALWPTGGFALSLGGMATQSALNEPFRADIELVAAELDDLESLQVTLASPVDFARAGLDRPFLLSKLRFKPMQLKDGRSVIRVTTREAVREPFLDFLVEVNWPKGRLVREFTALLDPPGTPERKPPAVVAPLLAPPREEHRPPSVPAAPPSRPQTQPPAMMTITGQYGPVQRGATLWGIAKGLKVAGAGTEQVAMALFRSNPEAFGGGDINMLRAGAVLRVPSPNDMLAQPLAEAHADLLAESKGVHRVNPMPPDRLRIALKPKEQPPQAEPSQGPLRAGDVEQVRTDLMMVRETSESNRQETEDLRSRIRELEAQLNDIRQLLKLKSDQLAQIQAGPTQAPAGETVPPPKAAESMPPRQTEAPVEGVSQTRAQVRPELPAHSDLPVTAEPAAQPEAVEHPAVGGPEAPAQQPETLPVAEQGPFQLPPQQVPVQATPPRRAALPPPPPTPSFLEQVQGDSTMLALAGAMLVALLTLGGLLLRRRRSTEVQFEGESALLGPGDGRAPEPEDPSMPTLAKVDTTEDTSFLSDFSPSDINALQEETGEVDPTAEADVYIAYGRYQQAESLIKQALDKTPGRPDLKLKLLEIYFTTRNVAAFTGLAEEMDAAGLPGREPQLWERVRSMGQELLPGHALFGMPERSATAPSGVEGKGIGQEPLSDMDELANLDLDLSSDLSQMASELHDGSVLDLSPRPKTAAPPPGRPTAPPPGAPDQESEFTLNLDDLSSLEDIDLGDLRLDSEVSLKTKSTHKKDVLSLPDKESTAPFFALSEEDEIPAISLDEVDLDMGGFEPTAVGGGTSSSEPLKTTDLGEEVETKLDLARAYLEMGDGEGAREILQEVLAEGNPTQQATARELLTQVR